MRAWIIGLAAASVVLNASADIIYVNVNAPGANTGMSWTDAYTDLADAFASAQAGDQIWVAQGTYFPPSKTMPFLIPSKVEVYGGFTGGETLLTQRSADPAITILSGDLNHDDLPGFLNRNDNAETIALFSLTEASTILDGFTLRGGYSTTNNNGGAVDFVQAAGTIINCRFVDNAAIRKGGAVWIDRGGVVAIRGCGFLNNSVRSVISSGDGGAIGMDNGTSGLTNVGTLMIEDCDFIGNTADGPTFASGGAIFVDRAVSVSVVGSSFEDNLASAGDIAEGGAISILDSPLDAVRCTFLKNNTSTTDTVSIENGGAIHHSANDAFDFNVVSCRFLGNESQGGGAIYVNTDGAFRLVGSLVAGNTSYFMGGGIRSLSATTIDSSTIAFNTCTRGLETGVGITCVSIDGLTVRNSILWGNSSSGSAAEAAQLSDATMSPSIGYSCIEGLTGAFGGPGNIGVDPKFFDADGNDNVFGTRDDNYLLRPFSPCIDAGSNAALPNDNLDLDGDGNTGEKLPLDAASMSRQIEDNGVANTGQGATPIVDVGAFERQQDSCLADTNSDGVVSPADFSAWVAAFNTMAPECDQNGDGSCTPADFSAWVANYNAGC
ncbi:MAG: hypothetical protein KDA31_11760 [Phycisphaerales bacterium]|nr:hypothetical protein [Phycisphaerales bacterium]MCB9835788.1 hypothetical protein [Phycisphaera sp.]